MNLRGLITDLSPPILIRLAQRLCRGTTRGNTEWEYWPKGWDDPRSSEVQGWDVKQVAEKEAEKWMDFVNSIRAPAELAQNHEHPERHFSSIEAHNDAMVFAYVISVASGNQSELSILDWGSGLPHYYEVAKQLYPELYLDYHCRDLPAVMSKARELCPAVKCHSSDTTVLSRKFDLVFASSSLQYCRNVWKKLAELAVLGNWVCITRMPFVSQAKSYVILQRAHRYGYGTEYLGWVLNRNEVITHMQLLGYELRRTFRVGGAPRVPGVPEQPEYRGYLFKHSDSVARD